MPKAEGLELSKSVFKLPLLKKYFPHWKKRDLVELCISILKKIKILHSNHIILGDINPMNILVKSPSEVYLIDCDSYQIDDFPCPVGTDSFSPPENIGKNFATFLRTKTHDNFAIAVLLFMILHVGKHPYDQQGGENITNNIKNQIFPYPLGEFSTKTAPLGNWKFMWSHLPRKIKQAFYESFQKNAKFSTPNAKFSVETWLDYFYDYLQKLDNGTIAQYDKMSLEIIPTRYKGYTSKVAEATKKGNYINCKICQKEILDKFELCFECHQKQTITKTCKDCKTSFKIFPNEIEIFKLNGWKLPIRCKKCRENQKRRWNP